MAQASSLAGSKGVDVKAAKLGTDTANPAGKSANAFANVGAFLLEACRVSPVELRTLLCPMVGVVVSDLVPQGNCACRNLRLGGVTGYFAVVSHKVCAKVLEQEPRYSPNMRPRA